MTKPTKKLRELLAAGGPAVQAGGVADAGQARLVEQVGFPAIYISGSYVNHTHGYVELSQHLLEDVEEGFISKIQPDDIFVVDSGFGSGKHSNGPIEALQDLSVAAVLAKGFSSVWERDSINLGFPSLVYPEVFDQVETGDVLELDSRAVQAGNVTRCEVFAVKPTPVGILELLVAGGIAPYTARLFGRPEADADVHH